MRYWRDPLDAGRIDAPRGDVRILADRCKGCAFCVEYCPRHVLEMSREFNRKGYHPPEIVDGQACVNCGLCEMICPEFAIFCIEQSESLGRSTELSAVSGPDTGEARP